MIRRVAARLLLAVAATAVLSRWLPGRWRLPVLAASFAPYLAPIGLAAGALDRRLITPGLGVAIGGLAPARPRPRRSAAPVCLTVLTTNVLHGRAHVAALSRLIAAPRADGVVIPEYTHTFEAALTAAGVLEQFPYGIRRPAPTGSGTALLSLHPTSDERVHEGHTFTTLSALVDAPGVGPLRAVAVHPAPPWPFPLEMYLRDFRLLAQLLDSFTGTPVVVAGDFNATPDHERFRALLRTGYRDAAAETGRAHHPTWPTDRRLVLPLLALDHVLVRGLGVAEMAFADVPGSDHRAVIARLTR